MDAEIEVKRDETYDHELEDRVLDWIEDVSGPHHLLAPFVLLFLIPCVGEECNSLFLSCQSGALLCRLANILRPGIVAKIHANRVALLERVRHCDYNALFRSFVAI